MPDNAVTREEPIVFGAVLDEEQTPVKVSAGLTQGSNFMYRRRGSWGKRPGFHQAYSGTETIAPTANNSGYRWYGAYPTPITQLVVIAMDWLWTGGDGAPNGSAPSALTPQANIVTNSSTVPPRFAAMRDPYWYNGTAYGQDNLIICGLRSGGTATSGTHANGFLQLVGTPGAGQTITLNVKLGASTIGVAYTALATDSPTSIFTQLGLELTTQVLATAGVPFLSPISTVNTPSQQANPNAQMWIGASSPGSNGNAIQYELLVTGSGMIGAPNAYTAMTGGGNVSAAPAVWTGSALSSLGWMYDPYGSGPPGYLGSSPGYAFTGCVTWHNHMWFFGDPNNPGKLFASDINQPQGLTFMAQYGGYPIGEGDGDPYIRALLPLGDTLYVFKSSHVYAITGYDFQQGEYQFQVTPVLNGYGTVSQETVAVLGSAAVFWTGTKMVRLAAGSFDPEDIGATIPYTLGLASTTVQTAMRLVAGSFQFASNLNNQYWSGAQNPFPATYIATDCLYFSYVDAGGNYHVLVYDDVATQQLGNYAWAPWASSAWQIGYWITEGGGANAAGTLVSEPFKLFFVPAFLGTNTCSVYQFGANPANDATSLVLTTPIVTFMQTGYMSLGNAASTKLLEMMYVDVEALGGAQLAITAIPAYYQKAQGNPAPQIPQATSGIAATVVNGFESFNTLSTKWEPALRGNAFMLYFTDVPVGTLTEPWELIGARVHFTEEPLQT